MTLAEDMVDELPDDVGLNSDLVAMDKKFSKGKKNKKRKKQEAKIQP